jgi:tetratricopeptide (TPR) repeat protein
MDLEAIAIVATIVAAIIGAVGSIVAAAITVRAKRRSTSDVSDSVDIGKSDHGGSPDTSRTSEPKDEKALRDFERVLELDPYDYDALNGKGWALFELGRYEEAL